MEFKIYAHVNKINGKIYIGQTMQQNLNRRWNTDGSGYKKSTHFWNAIQKYGWENFEHIIIIDNLSLDMANIFEEELIKKYKTTNPVHGYNLRFGGDNYKFSESSIQKMKDVRKGSQSGKLNNFYGKHHTEETKEKLRNNHIGRYPYFKGHHFSEESKRKLSESKKGKSNLKNRKQVIQYSDDNMNIKVWNSLRDAAEYFNGSTVSHIAACCKGKRNKAYGFKWRYVTDLQEEVS